MRRSDPALLGGPPITLPPGKFPCPSRFYSRHIIPPRVPLKLSTGRGPCFQFPVRTSGGKTWYALPVTASWRWWLLLAIAAAAAVRSCMVFSIEGWSPVLYSSHHAYSRLRCVQPFFSTKFSIPSSQFLIVLVRVSVFNSVFFYLCVFLTLCFFNSNSNMGTSW